MVVACACRDCMAAAGGRKAQCKAPAAALTIRCVVVRRCVARGDVHGDATIPVYIRCAGNSQPYEKGRRSERDMERCHVHVSAGTNGRGEAGGAERHEKQLNRQQRKCGMQQGSGISDVAAQCSSRQQTAGRGERTARYGKPMRRWAAPGHGTRTGLTPRCRKDWRTGERPATQQLDGAGDRTQWGLTAG